MYGTFPYIWVIFMVHVANYTSPMDPVGPANGKDTKQIQ